MYLSRGYVVLEGVDGQAEDVVVVAHVEALRVLLPVVHHPHGGHVVHNLPRLGVEQVAAAVIAPVAEHPSHTHIQSRVYRVHMDQDSKTHGPPEAIK